MKIKEIIEAIEKIAPLSLSDEFVERFNAYDNSGFILGNDNAEVMGVLTCLDVTREVLEEAVETNKNLIVSHHPFIYNSILNISSDSPKGDDIMYAIRNNLSIYSGHLNFDLANEGLDYIVAREIGLEDIVSIHKFSCGGYGKLGKINAVSVSKLSKKLDEVFDAKTRFSGENVIKTCISYCGGSGGDHMIVEDAIKYNADCVITGDIRPHIALELKSHKIAAIDLPHLAQEGLAMRHWTNILKKTLNIDMTFSKFDYRILI